MYRGCWHFLVMWDAWWLDKSLKFRVAAQSSNWFPQIKIDKDLMFMKIIMNTILLVSNISISCHPHRPRMV